MEKNLIILKDSLKKDIESSGWADILFPYIDSKLYDDLTDSLVSLVEQGKRFTPKFKDIFNAFKECKYDDLKVVIVGQDPYPQLGSADGLAFSCI
jgi:uracil-DNA glycosylase